MLRQLEAHRAAHTGPGEPPALVVRWRAQHAPTGSGRYLGSAPPPPAPGTAPHAPRTPRPDAPQVGISAPQGCGKTTLVGQLTELLNAEGHAAASVSIDDFYVRGDQQDAIAAGAPDNELLRFRGNPGTHDLQLASDTLDALRGLTAAGASSAIPLYDKSLRGGRGDRAPQAAWPRVTGPLQVVCLEGWCLGFPALSSDAAAAAVHPSLPAVNAALRTYPAAIESRVDAWVSVRVGDPTWVFSWRLQAEVEMRAAGKPGLSDEQVADFVARFMPAYKAYLPVRARDGAACALALSSGAEQARCVVAPRAGVLQGRPRGPRGHAAAGAGHRRHAHAHRRGVRLRRAAPCTVVVLYCVAAGAQRRPPSWLSVPEVIHEAVRVQRVAQAVQHQPREPHKQCCAHSRVPDRRLLPAPLAPAPRRRVSRARAAHAAHAARTRPMSSSSTSKMSVELGGIGPIARSPYLQRGATSAGCCARGAARRGAARRGARVHARVVGRAGQDGALAERQLCNACGG